MTDFEHREPFRLAEAPGEAARIAFFQTAAGPGETAYPDQADNPTVYYGRRLVNVTFTETVGAQELDYDETQSFAYVFSLSGSYLDEGTVIAARRENGRWFTC